jgi:hypothetical protein
MALRAGPLLFGSGMLGLTRFMFRASRRTVWDRLGEPSLPWVTTGGFAAFSEILSHRGGKIPQHGEADILAFFRMELHAA